MGGSLGSGGTASEIVNRLNALVAKFLQRPETRDALENDILEVKLMTPEQITAHFKNEIAIWTPVVANFLTKQK